MATKRKMPIVLLVDDPQELKEAPELAPAVHTLDTRRYPTVPLLCRALLNFHATAELAVGNLAGAQSLSEFCGAPGASDVQFSGPGFAGQAGRSVEILCNVVAKVRSRTLPGPVVPDMIGRVQTLMDEGVDDPQAVIDFAEQHQCLAAQLLCAVNGGSTQLEEPVVSVERAVEILGVRQSLNLLHAGAALTYLRGEHAGLRRLVVDNLRHAYFVALINRWLAERDEALVGRSEPARAFEFGLFHNIGATFLYYAAGLLHTHGELGEIDCAALRITGRGRAGLLNRMLSGHMRLPDMISGSEESDGAGASSPHRSCLLRALWVAEQVHKSGPGALRVTPQSQALSLTAETLEELVEAMPDLQRTLHAYLRGLD